MRRKIETKERHAIVASKRQLLQHRAFLVPGKAVNTVSHCRTPTNISSAGIPIDSSRVLRF